MEIDNPYLERKRELYLEIDRLERETDPQLKASLKFKEKELFDIQEKEKALIQKIIAEYQSKVNSTETLKEEIIKNKSEYPSLNKQYKAMMQLHRDAKRLCNDIKIAKIGIIRTIQAGRKSNS